MDAPRHPGAFAAQQQRIYRPERKVWISQRRLRRQQNEPRAAPSQRLLEGGKVRVSHDVDVLQIVEASATQRPVGHVKTRRADDLDGRAQAGRQAQDGAGILWNVRLVEG